MVLTIAGFEFAFLNSIIIGMIMILFYRDIWENFSDLKDKYNWFVFNFFDFSPIEVSCLNTYRIAIMWSYEGKVFSTVYKASVAIEILHIAFFSSSNSTFFCLFSR